MVAPIVTIPFTRQVYTGDEPGLVVVVVKVTNVPVQTGLSEGVIETVGKTVGLIVIVIGLETAGFPVAQLISDVTRQVITCPFKGV